MEPHLAGIQSSWSNSQHPGTLFSAQPWGPFGLTSATLGANISLSRTYNNNRGFLNYEKDSSSGAGTLYTYTLGFDPVGNVNSINDTVIGNWTYTYDVLNRLQGGSATSAPCNGMNISWGFDPWGNRTSQSASGSSGCSISQPSYTFNTKNQIADGYYDLSGDRTRDVANNVLAYDAEGRVASVNGSTYYVYDAESRRVAKKNSSGTVTASYALNLNGAQVAEINGSGQWQHSNIFSMGHAFATYDSNGTRFHLTDALGTRRAQGHVDGTQGLTCFSYPFGDGLNCSGSDEDSTEHHYTGKERDAESGNDYFGARYYASSMGRFLSPDPAGGHTEDPQTLNKYSYVANNPLIRTDPTGLDFNLQCTQTKDNASTCQGGIQGTTTTDANGKSSFTKTVISNGANGGLVDQNGNKYNATVSGAGVSFSQAGSSQSSIGTFINGTNATTIQGSGALAGFTFNFTSSDMAAHLNSQGTFTYSGNADQAMAALKQAGFQQYPEDLLDFYHPNTNSYTAVDFRSPGAQGTGAGGGHLVVQYPVDVAAEMQDKFMRLPVLTVPTSGTADLGTTNPYSYGGAGLTKHIKEALTHNNQ